MKCPLLAVTVLGSLTSRFMLCREAAWCSGGSLRPGEEALAASLGSVTCWLCYLEQGVRMRVFRSNFSMYPVT